MIPPNLEKAGFSMYMFASISAFRRAFLVERE